LDFALKPVLRFSFVSPGFSSHEFLGSVFISAVRVNIRATVAFEWCPFGDYRLYFLWKN